MDTAFPDANVENYRSLIKSIELPDPNDRHVVAAAVRSKADVIVTYNLKDFPAIALGEFDIEVQHPDTFLFNVFDLNPDKAIVSFKKLVSRLKNPPKSAENVHETLKKANLKNIIEKLREVR